MNVKLKLWGIFTKNGELLYTDKEACIYSDYNTADKEKGSHFIKSITVIYLRNNK